MCMIIYHPAGTPMMKDKFFRSVMERNPHGFGIHVPGKDVVYKCTDPEQFFRYYKTLEIHDEFLIHCRLATTGSVKPKNCHPFMDKKTGTVFAHNGIISIPTTGDKTDSETYFRECIIPDLEYLIAEEPPMFVNRLNGSRLSLYIPGVGQTLYGDWYCLNGVYFSKYVPGSKLCHYKHFTHPKRVLKKKTA